MSKQRPPRKQISSQEDVLTSAVACREVGDLNTALKILYEGLEIFPTNAKLFATLSHCLILQNDLNEAEAVLEDAKRFDPDEPLIAWNEARLCLKIGKYSEAFEVARRASEQFPDDVEGSVVLASCLRLTGQFDSCLSLLNRVIGCYPNYAEALINRGLVKLEQNKLRPALDDIESAHNLKPHIVDIWDLLVRLKINYDQYSETRELITKLIEIDGEKPRLLSALGWCNQKLNNFDLATLAYQKALKIEPNLTECRTNLEVCYLNWGNLLAAQNKLEEARQIYFRLLKFNPGCTEAQINLGVIYQKENRLDEAVRAFEYVISQQANSETAWYNLGLVQHEQGRYDRAAIAYSKAIKINPSNAKALSNRLLVWSAMCQWERIRNSAEDIECLGVDGDAIAPFSMLTMEDAPERHLKRSQKYAAKWRFSGAAITKTPHEIRISAKIRIGYFSSDFHNHATMSLIARVFELHDRACFEIFIFSFGPRKSDSMRQRLTRTAVNFFELNNVADEEIVNLARKHKLDIAVDLKGYTKGHRFSLFSSRLAPIQISYLGYPGSSGADCIDYIFADTTVIPPDSRRFYSESVVYLPHTYQCNDDKRQASTAQTTRADFGLPENALVFCCFNNCYKITDAEFDIWTDILANRDHSVLWLMHCNEWARVNMIEFAEMKGIASSRIKFANKLPPDQHLARLKHADLFLDTFNCNAHTTASDALWSGVPLITLQGKGFAARVSASLLHAVGLPELVTQNEKEYKQLIIEIASDHEKLQYLKAKLRNNKLTHPLFDSMRFTKNLEMAYKEVYRLRCEGKSVTSLSVTDIYAQ